MSEVRVNRFMIKKRTDSSVENQAAVSEFEKPVEPIVSMEPTILEEPIVSQVEQDTNSKNSEPAIKWESIVPEPINLATTESSIEQPITIESESTHSISEQHIAVETESSTHPDTDAKKEYWPDAATWTAIFAPERTTKSLEHEVDRLTKRLQRVENAINRSSGKNTRLNRVFTGQFGELVRTAVRNEDINSLNRLLAYADSHRAPVVQKKSETEVEQSEAPIEQNNAQVSLQNNHELERQLESAMETIERLKSQQTDYNLSQYYKRKYEELYEIYNREKQSRSQESSITEQRDRAHRLLNEYRAKVEALNNELTALKESSGKYAIDEIVIEGTGVHVRYDNKIAYVSSLFAAPTINLDVSGVRVREENGVFIVEDDPDEPSTYHQQRYEELSIKYHSLEQEMIQAAENFEKMRVEIIDLHGKKMAQKDTLVAYHEAKVRELQNDHAEYREHMQGVTNENDKTHAILRQRIADLTNELVTTKKVLDGIMQMVD